MRICLYSSAYAPQRGGIESASASLAAAWQKAGHDVLLVSETNADADYDATSPFTVLRHPSRGDWRRIVRDYDVVISNGFALRHLLTWLFYGALFWWIHQSFIAWRNPTGVPWYEKFRWKVRGKTRPLLTRLARGGNIYISHALKTYLRTAEGPVIYNPVADIFRPMGDVPIAADFGFFGRMWLAKGQDTMLRALARCREAGYHFTADFYGDGEHLQQIKQIARELKLENVVRFIPSVSGDDLVRAINSVGVVVMPSAWDEPMGMVAVEAMACGKCVIGTNRGGLGEVLEGWMPTFDNHNDQQLSELMIATRTDDTLRQKYERAARERATAFSQAVIAEKYIAVFQERLART
jgi:glycosyltransferase involved in cell wall biosynthesis